MKKIKGIVILALLLTVLIGCGKTHDIKIEITALTPARTSVYIEIDVADPKNLITPNTIELVLYYKGNIHSRQIVSKDSEAEIYSITITGLDIDYEYEANVFVTVQKKLHKLASKTFKTSTVGSSEEEPKLVYTIQDFKDIEKDVTAYYRLENDLDFEGDEYISLFQSASFQGVFDGNNKTIKNFVIQTRKGYLGLFARNAGTVKNLVVENAEISLISTNSYSQYIGIISGRNTGTIENVNVKGSIVTAFSYTGKIYIGGIVGFNDANSKVIDSKADVSINSQSSSRTEFYMGALIGGMTASELYNSYAKGNLVVTNADTGFIGGAVGHATSSALVVSEIKDVEVDLTLKLKTEVKNIAPDETIAISAGGVIGKLVEGKIINAYAKSNITVNKMINSANNQSKLDTLAIGGIVGTSSSNVVLKEVLSQTNITMVSEEDVFTGIDRIYLGGIAGEAYKTTLDKAFAKTPFMNIKTEFGKYVINATVGNGSNLGDFDLFALVVDQVSYSNKKVTVSFVLDETEDDPEEETYLREIQVEDLEPTDITDYFTSEFINNILNRD